MEKYILNETPVRTTEGFKINNINIELDIPELEDFDDFIIENSKNIEITYKKINKPIETKIGITYKKYYEVNIRILENSINNELIVLTNSFENNSSLIDNINITFSKGSKANLLINYNSVISKYTYHHLIQKVTMEENSNGTISIINNLNKESVNMLEIETNIENSATLKTNIFDLGASKIINRFYGKLNSFKATNYLNNIYIGQNKDIIDMNYHVQNIGKNTFNNIEVQGVLMDEASKNFKGTIDFIEGSSKSVGKENENCILLSEKAKSKSLPMLLCHEEDVEGAHGVSTGKVDEEKLFYLNSRGYSEKEALKLIVNSNFNKIIKEVENEKVEDRLYTLIDEKLSM